MVPHLAVQWEQEMATGLDFQKGPKLEVPEDDGNVTRDISEMIYI